MDTPPDAMPSDILDPYPLSYGNPGYRWPLVGHARSADDSPAVPLLHARVMGGGSSIMGMVMLRGYPADYDGWAELGAAGWNWDAVLPYFRLLENDLDFDGPLHGRSGPTEIRRHRVQDWPDLAHAASVYSARTGIPFIADMNADFRDGYGALPVAGTRQRRSTSAQAYLTTQVRRRPNLRIIANATAAGLTYDGARATGVRVDTRDGQQTVAAREVILSMGALLSPHFLLRDGIGDPAQLRANGIEVRAALPGVGANLQNHAAVLTMAHLRRSAVQRHPQRNHNNTILRYTSCVPGATASDMALSISTRVAWHAVARRVANLTPMVMAPASRGRVSLGARGEAPLIEYRLLDSPTDQARLEEGLFTAAALAKAPEMSRIIGRVVAASRLANAARFNARTTWNDVRARAIATLLDYVPGLGDRVVGTMGDEALGDLLADQDRLSAFVERNVTPLAHHAGTCRMGAPGDKGSVCDSSGRVIGVNGLRVVDASLMPTVPRANTNLPVLMIAEKIAHDIMQAKR